MRKIVYRNNKIRSNRLNKEKMVKLNIKSNACKMKREKLQMKKLQHRTELKMVNKSYCTISRIRHFIKSLNNPTSGIIIN